MKNEELEFDPGLWNQIANDRTSAKVVLRRVLPHLEHDVFIGETRPGRRCLVDLLIHGEPGSLPKLRKSKGLDIQVEQKGYAQTRIQLVSTSPVGDPLFMDLATDVIRTLAVSPGKGAAARVLDRVAAWQEFLARQAEPMSREAAAGLFAEIVVLRDDMLPELGGLSAVVAWTGPDPAIQDFQRGGVALEVKSYRGTGPGKMRISSERQLETVGLEVLYLAYVELDERADGTGSTLGDLVDSVRTRLLKSAQAYHLFEGKLIASGWHDSYRELRTEKYELRSVEYFEVCDDFPRLVSSALPDGVGSVSYILDRSPLGPFLRARDAVLNQMKAAQ